MALMQAVVLINTAGWFFSPISYNCEVLAWDNKPHCIVCASLEKTVHYSDRNYCWGALLPSWICLEFVVLHLNILLVICHRQGRGVASTLLTLINTKFEIKSLIVKLYERIQPYRHHRAIISRVEINQIESKMIVVVCWLVLCQFDTS